MPSSEPAGPLSGKRVLVTRAAHQADEFAAALAANGMVPVFAPVIEIGPPDDVRAAHRAIDVLDSFAWVVFTARNGVDAFFDRVASLNADARLLGGIKVAAIGTQTAQRLEHFGIRADLVPSTFVSEEIARALIERCKRGDRVLIYRAQEARDVLPAMLADAGLEAVVVAAYKTRVARDGGVREKAETCDVLTFTSASTVDAFVELVGGAQAAVALASKKIVACIGPIAAEAALRNGLRVDVVPPTSTTGGIVEALLTHADDTP